MPRKFFRKYLPHHDQVREHRHLRWFRPLLRHPNLWHLNRDSVAGGVAAGLFGGLIPGPVQILTAAILAVLFRVNLPIAMVATLYTNPLTWGPLIIAAYNIGSFITGESGELKAMPEFHWSGDWLAYLPQFVHWLMGLGETFLIGNLILAGSLAVLGYAGVQLGWRIYLLAYLRRRRQRAHNPPPHVWPGKPG